MPNMSYDSTAACSQKTTHDHSAFWSSLPLGQKKILAGFGCARGKFVGSPRFFRHAIATTNRIHVGVVEVELSFSFKSKMKLQIDNLDGLGPVNYTSAIDGSRSPQVIRKLNQPSELRVSLVADSPNFVVPKTGARVTLGLTNGQDVFTGYLMQSPVFEYLGWGERGPVYRYDLVAQSDEALLDEKRLPDRCPFLDRSAGNALRQLTQDLLPGVFDTSAVQDLDTIAWYASDPRKTWSQQAAEIAILARASYRIRNGALTYAPLGAMAYALNETDTTFCPEGLKLQPVNGLINDVTVIGQSEPQAYVKDYFIGDGLTLKFNLSQTPFTKTSKTLFDEEYTVSPLEPTLWSVTDPSNVISVSGGELRIAGGTGVDGATRIQFG